jgi:hypothetical protein
MRILGMSNIEDYPGPSSDHPEKEGVGGPANENIVQPPATPEDEKKEEPSKTKKRSKNRSTRSHVLGSAFLGPLPLFR